MLAMNFLNPNGAVIDLPESTITFSKKKGIARSIACLHDRILRIVDDNVTLPAHASLPVDLKIDAFMDYEV